MKTRIAAFIVIALGSPGFLLAQPAPTPPTVGTAPHLQNTSFETAGSSEVSADHWGTWGEGVARVTDWKPVKIGTAMMAYKHWETKSDDNSGMFQDALFIKAGSKYRFVVPVFLDKPDFGGSPKSIELRLESTINGAQVTVASKTFDLAAASAALPYSKWTPLEVIGTAPVDGLRVLIVVSPQQGQRGGSVKMDAVRLEDMK
ncbi:MAG: hypothetical protein ACREKL_14530 [Chthoniobacterales bacterium]